MSSGTRRFEIRRSGWMTPLLALFGATASRSYIEVDSRQLFARFGFYRISIPRDRIASVEHFDWAWYRGIGWRTNLRNMIALTGSTHGVVHIRLSQPLRTRMLLIPVRMTDFYVSAENSDGLIAALARR